MAVTGLTKAAKSVANYVGRKAKNTALRGVVKTVNATNRAGDATADLVRKGLRASDAFDNATLGPIGKATRNASAAVIKATRSARPRARETMGQINARKGIVNKKYTPSQMDGHVKVRDNYMSNKMTSGRKINLNKPAINLKKDMTDFRRNKGNMNYNQKKDGVVGNADNYVNKPREQYMHEMPYDKPQDNIGMMKKSYEQPAFDRSKLSYDEIKPTGRSGPRYTNKQVQAGRKVATGALVTGYAASEYYKAKKANR